MKSMRKTFPFVLIFCFILSCKTSKEPRVTLNTDAGRFSIASLNIGIKNVDLIIHTSSKGMDEDLYLPKAPLLSESVDYFKDEIGSGGRIIIEGREDGRYRIVLHIHDYSSNFFTLNASIENLSSEPLTVYGFSFVPQDISGDPPDGVMANGYQSWSPAVVSKIISGNEMEEKNFENIENNQDTISVDYRNSWWFSLLHNPKQSIVWGALTAKTWKTRVITYSNENKVIAKIIVGRTYVSEAVARDLVILKPGSSISSETVLIGIYNDPVEGLDSYGSFIEKLNPPPAAPFIPLGWNSWNELFSNITETKIMENARFIKDNLPEHGFNNIQIDDGWEKSWGDWEPNAKFSSGMDHLATQLKNMGFIPGIWLAPFLISDTAPIYIQHNDYLLKDENGSLLKYERYYILDTSNPEALNWLLTQIQKIISWGYRYLKLDFLFAGAYEGKRLNGKTSLQSYRDTMLRILELANNSGAYVLACGAPILPTAGLAHGARIGGDIALSALPYNFSFIKNEARNIANRFFLNNVFANDPDTALLRDVPLEEARMNLTSVLLSGKIFALGDNLPSLPQEKIEMIKKIKDFPIFNEIKNPATKLLLPRPIDLFNNFSEPSQSVASLFVYPESYFVPSVWAVKLNDTSAVIGLFNWENEPAQLKFSLPDAGLEKGKTYTALELWSGNTLPPVIDSYETVIDAHNVELIFLSAE